MGRDELAVSSTGIKRIAQWIPFARDVRRWFQRLTARAAYWRDFYTFTRRSAHTTPRFIARWRDRYPCLDDKTAKTGFDYHYIYHTAWAARIVAQNRPVYHVDISSSLYFCALVSAFVPVRFYDFRPADLRLSHLTSEPANLMGLPFANASIQSLSCMHVVEHVGLGRYGDPIDPDGDLKAMTEIRRVLAPGGSLLFVVPTGRPKIRFNAHRIYSYSQIASAFADLKLRQFALIRDAGDLIENASQEMADAQTYGCGCFWFQRHDGQL
jgi:SAM-dependent methyltransferase